jgi:hypothetical protein
MINPVFRFDHVDVISKEPEASANWSMETRDDRYEAHRASAAGTLSISAAEHYACARPRLRADSTAKLLHNTRRSGHNAGVSPISPFSDAILNHSAPNRVAREFSSQSS